MTVSAGAASPARLPTTSAPLRIGIWLLHVALPLLGLWLLLAQPATDLHWEHHHAHAVLVLLAAVVSGLLGWQVARDAQRHDDARLLLVGAAFVASAGFFAAHALTTPAVIVDTANLGWTASTTIGLLLAAVLVVLASVEWTGGRGAWPLRNAGFVLGSVVVIVVGWILASLNKVPPFDDAVTIEEARGWLSIVAALAGVGFTIAAVRLWRLHRRRPSATLISVVTALVLLGEAALATVVGRTWHLSWWLWHVLLVVSFAFVAYSASVEHRRRGRVNSLFRGVALDATIAEIHHQYSAALEQLVDAMGTGRDAGSVAAVADAVAQRFDLSEDERDVLQRAAIALSRERETTARLDAMVAVGEGASVVADDEALVATSLDRLRPAFAPDVLSIELGAGLVDAASLARPGSIEAPITVKGVPAGVVRIDRRSGRFDRQDRALLASVGSLLGTQLENARLYATMDTLFRRYLAPSVVTRLLADPSQASLGGAVVEVSTLFADLRGFTTFSESHPPQEVVALLNRYYSATVPRIVELGGTVMKFAGDALMAVWNAPVRQPDHALLAARAGLAIHAAIAEVTGGDTRLPVFRVGINTGPAVVGNVGSDEVRDYTAIGDSVNVAARLEGEAVPGEVLLGGRTRDLLGDSARVEERGALELRGKDTPIRAFRLISLTAG